MIQNDMNYETTGKVQGGDTMSYMKNYKDKKDECM